MVLHRTGNPGLSGLPGSIPGLGVFFEFTAQRYCVFKIVTNSEVL